MAAKQRMEDERDRDMSLAWQIEVLHRQKKLPALKTLFTKRTKGHSVSNQRTMLHILSGQYGIPLQPLSEAAKQALKRVH